MLVDLYAAKMHLRVDGGHEDELIELYVTAAQEQAEQFLGRRAYPDTAALAAAVLAGKAGADPMVANDSIRAAVLLIAGHLHAHRENVVVGAQVGELPMGAHSLLRPWRVAMGV